MKIERIVVGPFEVNCFVMWDEISLRAAVIDPGADATVIADLLRREHLSVDHYLLTHGHVDHLSALAELTDEFAAPVIFHPDDAAWAFKPANRLAPYYPVPRVPATPIDFPEDLRVRTAGAECLIIPTPGHSPGGVCYYFADLKLLFSGDTLFQGTVGRTDLPGGDTRTLATSLSKLKNLPLETRLLPGHGLESNLGVEIKTNPFLQAG